MITQINSVKELINSMENNVKEFSVFLDENKSDEESSYINILSSNKKYEFKVINKYICGRLI